jgi:hypothetical protein
MHQVFSQSLVMEKHIFVQPILLLVMLCNIFLGHNLQEERNELNTHMWVVDATVHYNRNGAS